MQSFPINWWAVIVAALVKFVLGWIWYSPIMGAQWRTAVGISEADMRASLPRSLPVDIIGSLVMSFILLHSVHYAGATTLLQGGAVGFLNWLGFIATIQLSQTIYEKRPFRLFVINNIYLVVSLIIMGAILAIWDYGAAATPAA
jgi:hypothetical protein